MPVSRSIPVAANGIILVLFMTELCFIVYMYHIFFISSVDECLGCFHVLAIVNGVASQCGCPFELRFSLVIYPGVGLLAHMVALFLGF